jgi:hypothetical protein
MSQALGRRSTSLFQVAAKPLRARRPRVADSGGRTYSECDTLTRRGPPDVHGQLYRCVRRSAFGGRDRRIHLRGRSSRRLGAKGDGWADVIAPGTDLEIQVREPATCHRITVLQIRRWCDVVAASPDETLKKRRLTQLLA